MSIRVSPKFARYLESLTVPEMPPNGLMLVYMHLDSFGQYLYIGQTSRFTIRQDQHSRTAEWWGQVKEIRWEPSLVQTNEVLDTLELDFITRLKPVHNRPRHRFPTTPPPRLSGELKSQQSTG